MSIPILMKPTDQDPLFFKKKLLNLESVMYTVCLRSKDELSIWDKDLWAGGRNLRVILVRVCGPVFRNLPQSYAF